MSEYSRQSKSALVKLLVEKGWEKDEVEEMSKKELINILEKGIDAPKELAASPKLETKNERFEYPDENGDTVGPDLRFVDRHIDMPPVAKSTRARAIDPLSNAMAALRKVKIDDAKVAAGQLLAGTVDDQLAWAESNNKAGLVFSLKGKDNRNILYVAGKTARVIEYLVSELKNHGVSFTRENDEQHEGDYLLTKLTLNAGEAAA